MLTFIRLILFFRESFFSLILVVNILLILDRFFIYFCCLLRRVDSLLNLWWIVLIAHIIIKLIIHHIQIKCWVSLIWNSLHWFSSILHFAWRRVNHQALLGFRREISIVSFLIFFPFLRTEDRFKWIEFFLSFIHLRGDSCRWRLHCSIWRYFYLWKVYIFSCDRKQDISNMCIPSLLIAFLDSKHKNGLDI